MVRITGTVFACQLLFINLVASHRNLCQNNNITPHNSTEPRFSERFGPPPTRFGCTNELVPLTCCSDTFSRIEWYQQMDDGQWKDFRRAGEQRSLYDGNQTAVLEYPYFSDTASYKCIVYGQTDDNSNSISHVTRLNINDCVSVPGLPIPFYPPQELTVVKVEVGNQLEVACDGFFGDKRGATSHCGVGWDQVLNGRRQTIGGDQTQRTYVINDVTIYDGNGIRSVLNITRVLEEDNTTEFICWMYDDKGRVDPARILRFHETRVNISLNLIYLVATALCVTVILLSVIIAVIRCRYGQRLQHFVEEWRRKPPVNEGLMHDVLLLSGEQQTSCDSFSQYMSQHLRQRSPYQYSVFHHPDDVKGELCLSEVFFQELKQSRCLLVVLSPELLVDENAVFCLNSAIDEVDTVFVLHGGISSVTDDRLDTLSEKVLLALRHTSPRVVWPRHDAEFPRPGEGAQTPRDAGIGSWRELEKMYGKEVEIFWNKVLRAIPIRRREKAVSVGCCSYRS